MYLLKASVMNLPYFFFFSLTVVFTCFFLDSIAYGLSLFQAGSLKSEDAKLQTDSNPKPSEVSSSRIFDLMGMACG